MFKFIDSLFADLFDKEEKYSKSLKTSEVNRFGVLHVFEGTIVYGINFKDDGIDYELTLTVGQARQQIVGLTKTGDMIEFAVAFDSGQKIKVFKNLTQLREKYLFHEEEKLKKSKIS